MSCGADTDVEEDTASGWLTGIEEVDGSISGFVLRLPAGSRHDPVGKAGTAHLVEHLLMRSKPDSLGETYAALLARSGAEYSIATSRDAIEFAVAVQSKKLRSTLEATRLIIKARLSLLLGSAVDGERSVIRDELTRHTSDHREAAVVQSAIRKLISSDSSLWQSPLGLESDLQRIGRADVLAFAGTHLDVSRAELGVVVGGKLELTGGSWWSLKRKEDFHQIPQLEPLSYSDHFEGRRMVAFRLPPSTDQAYESCVWSLRATVTLLPAELRAFLSVTPLEQSASVGVIFYSPDASVGHALEELLSKGLRQLADNCDTDRLRAAAARTRFRSLRQRADLRWRAHCLAQGFHPNDLVSSVDQVDHLDRDEIIRHLGIETVEPWLCATPIPEKRGRLG